MSQDIPDRFTCEQVFRRLDDYLDRELTAAEVGRIEDHLTACEVCAREYAFEAGVLRALRDRLRRHEVPATLVARVARMLDEAHGGGRGA